MAIFLYGSLCDPQLLNLVVGRDAFDELRPATLCDYAIYWVKGAGYPCFLEAPGHEVQGLLFADPTPSDLAAMDFYEACFAYPKMAVTLADGTPAEVYLQSDTPTPGAPWDLAVWQAKWGEISRIAAREVMAAQGVEPPEQVGARFASIRARASAQISARDGATPQVGRGFTADQVEILGRTRDYDKFFAVDDVELKHPKFSGGSSAPIKRAVFLMADAVTVLPYDPIRDRVLLVEQFRAGPLVRGDQYPWVLEPIAGRIDPGETPEQAARREAQEEAGITLKGLEKIGGYYPSPGGVTEHLTSYVALADLPQTEDRFGGLDIEGEDIRSVTLGFDELMGLLRTGEAANGPLILSALWLAQNRDRLRP